jgi:hypothetical protein
MKLSTLNNKLTKLNAEVTTQDHNGYNMSVVFTINGKSYEADYNKGENNIIGFSFTTGYDDAIQETTRRFFDNFNQVLRHSNR